MLQGKCERLLGLARTATDANATRVQGLGLRSCKNDHVTVG